MNKSYKAISAKDLSVVEIKDAYIENSNFCLEVSADPLRFFSWLSSQPNKRSIQVAKSKSFINPPITFCL